MNKNFFYIDELVPGIRWDAKYATWDNFTGKPVDGYVANRIVGTEALCAGVARAQEKAATIGFGLLLWDGYRPQRAVNCFLRWSEQPEDGRKKLRHHPHIDRPEMFVKGYVAARSGHSRGSTVDLTLYHLASGELARMGGDHDLMDPVIPSRSTWDYARRDKNPTTSSYCHGGQRIRPLRPRMVALHTQGRTLPRHVL